MIKQIQLRGISHSPSDRMTQDGGVEDCIDLRLEDQEHGPATEPLDVTDELAPGLSESGIDVLYIHKTNNYTNYVGMLAGSLVAWVKVDEDTWDVDTIHALGVGESVVSLTSIYNMLIYSLSSGFTGHALFKDGGYTDFGDTLPRPKVSFSTTAIPQTAMRKSTYATRSYNNAVEHARSVVNVDAQRFWEYIMSLRGQAGTGAHEEEDAFYAAVMESVWSDVEALRKNNATSGNFSAPVMVRYALRMYDGSYVNVSEPIILTGTAENMHLAKILSNIGSVSEDYYFIFDMMLTNVFSASVSILFSEASDWKELISSVDIFLSTDILVPTLRADFASMATRESTQMTYESYVMVGYDATIGYAIDNERDVFVEQMLAKGNFYKVASFPIDNLPTAGVQLKARSQDELVVLPRLTEAQAHTITGCGVLSSYNNRLATGEQKVTLSPGHSAPQALVAGTGDSCHYQIVYRVRDTEGQVHVVRGYDVHLNLDSALAYVSYPDPKCISATIYVTDTNNHTTVHTVSMKEHPRLDVAYAFFGLDRSFGRAPGGSPPEWVGISYDEIHTPETENPIYFVPNRLALSEMDNPFVFPLGQRERFSSRILAVVPATIALSTNMSGPYSMYIFTEDGIWAESINEEGGLANKLVVSRDVAVEGTITQLDKAVVFVSGQGIMYLEGNQVVNLSPYMDGPQYTIAEFAPVGSSLRTALTREGFDALLDISVDTTDFQDFALACKPLYDYANKRILFFKADESYGYEYALDTQTWHKVSVPAAFVRTLNGYPQAYAVFGGAIYDWSVRPDYNAANPGSRKGWILTRPFDLGEPDVRKSIRSIRIRGRFHRNNVRYLLFGSFDGIHWQRLTSLGGGSYKMFRILLLTDLEPEERVSWIDVDYVSRFQTKLR